MTEPVPALDTIAFDQLVELARGLIPRYAPDWTDHNLHDPGITLVDLLAWIVDQQVYRAGFVGGSHRRAFAALLGTQPQGPAPARGLVWPHRPVGDGRFVVAGSAVVCPSHPDLRFVLEYDLFLTSAALTGVSVTVDGVAVPPPSLEPDGGSWTLGGSAGMAGTVVEFVFDGPLDAEAGAAQVSLGLDLAPPPGHGVQPGDPPWGPVTYSYRRASATRWTRLSVVYDGTAGLATAGVVILSVPRHAAGAEGSRLRLTFDHGFFPTLPQIRGATINVLPVVQYEQVPEAAFEQSGTGLPDQEVELDTTDLVSPLSRPEGPVLEIRVAGVTWQATADLARSGPRDQHFVVLPDRIVFGNAVNGLPPGRGAQLAHTDLARTMGATGNVRPGLPWSVPALGADGIDYGVNRQRMSGGRDAGEADDLVRAARDAATSRDAMVTDDDVARAARALPGMAVGRAEVLAGFDRRMPGWPGRRLDGVRTLVVAPTVPAGTREGAVDPGYAAEVAGRLAPRRLLGERLIVQVPVLVRVDIQMTVTVVAGWPIGDVEDAVRSALEGRLTAVARGGLDPWPLGWPVTSSDVLGIAVGVSGVVDVPAVQLAAAGDPAGLGPVRVPPDGVAVAGDVRVTGRSAQVGEE
jgi:hypothetical protein